MACGHFADIRRDLLAVLRATRVRRVERSARFPERFAAINAVNPPPTTRPRGETAATRRIRRRTQNRTLRHWHGRLRGRRRCVSRVAPQCRRAWCRRPDEALGY